MTTREAQADSSDSTFSNVAYRDAGAFEEPSARARQGWERYALAGVMILGILLRLRGILAFPFDQDELYTIEEARDLFHTTLKPGIDSRPLYYLLEHPLLTLLPQNEVALRLLALVFGVAGLWVTWWLGRKRLGAMGGILATFLVAISPWHLYASVTARYYSLVYLCAALAFLYVPDAYEEDTPRSYVRALCVLIVGTLTHPSFLFPMIGLVTALAIVRPSGRVGWSWPSSRAWRWLWGPYAFAIAAEVVVLQLLHRGTALANQGSRGLPATLRLVPAMVEWMTIPVFAAAAVGALVLIVSRERARRLGAVAVLSVVGTLCALFAASFRTGVYADYGIGMLPIVFVVSASVVRYVAARSAAAPTAAAAFLFGLTVAPSTISFLSDGMRFDYRPAYDRIAKEGPELAVVSWPVVLREWYAPRLRAYELRPNAAYLDSLLARERTLWLVASVKRYGFVEDDAGVVEGWVSAHCRFVARYEWPRIDYRVYRVELYRCGVTP